MTTPDRRVIAVAGLVSALGAYFGSAVTSGLLGASLFMVAVATVPISLGLALSLAHSPTRPLVRFRRMTVARLARCGQCGSERRLQGGAFICAVCD